MTSDDERREIHRADVASTDTHVLPGGGEMGALMRSIDWSATPVGAVATWPQSLRTALSILLESRFPMYIAWGSEFVQFYNDGYRPVLGSSKHPAAMGARASQTFAESWHIIGPMFEGVMKGTAVGSEDWMLPLDRHGYLEGCYFTFSYSPIRDESGGVGGVNVTVAETTARVLGERRMRTLRDLAAQTAAARSEMEAWEKAPEALRENPLDLPFVLTYRAAASADAQAELVASIGFESDVPLVDAVRNSRAWPLEEVLAVGRAEVALDLRATLGKLPAGGWPESPDRALVLPIARSDAEKPYGFLVAGISARRADPLW